MNGEWIFIEPQDVWMFRDSKPFAAQQSFVARSIFPPTPQTVQGAIRTAYLESVGVSWEAYRQRNVDAAVLQAVGGPAANGVAPDIGALSLRGPFVGRRTAEGIRRFVRTPQDVLRSETDENRFVILQPRRTATFDTDPPFDGWRPLGFSESGQFEAAGGWLGEDEFREYLVGSQPHRVFSEAGLFIREPRTGLALDTTRRVARAEERLLYHAHFVRPHEGVGLLLELNEGLLPEYGMLTLGGESRAAVYQSVPYEEPEIPRTGNLKVVLLTPAFFSGGWGPTNGDWSRWLSRGRLVSMALGKPDVISGWDMVRNEAKPLYQYVPAGSVYYFEDAELTGQGFTETPDDSLDHAAIGFGAFAAGPWTYLDE